jgi:hypothetical protein
MRETFWLSYGRRNGVGASYRLCKRCLAAGIESKATLAVHTRRWWWPLPKEELICEACWKTEDRMRTGQGSGAFEGEEPC